MLNGDSLLGNISSTQSSLIVPQPDSDRFFYVFTTSDFYVDALQYGFNYSIVDICLDNGYGGVIEDFKNESITDNVCEKLTAVRHSNGQDYWIIVHKYNSNEFQTYLLSATGLGAPVISQVGSIHTTNPSTNLGASIGQMKASPDGTKVAVTNGNASSSILEYFDFDNTTGVISNRVNLNWDTNYQFYGLSFSPDNSKLYVSSSLNGNGIYQFDLTAGAGDPTAVFNSRVQIASGLNFLGLQLANNGKIYCAASPFMGNMTLHSIESPNLPGSQCNYMNNSVLLDGNSASYGFPNFIDSYDYSNTMNDCNKVGVSPAPDSQHVDIYMDSEANQVVVKIDDEDVTVVSIEVMDAQGKLVRNIENISSRSTIDLNTLSSGTYYVRVTTSAGSSIVQNFSILRR